MAIAFIDSLAKVSFNSGTSAQSAAFGTNCNIGETIVVCHAMFANNGGVSNAPTDVLGNTYSSLASIDLFSGNCQIYMWASVLTTGGASNKVTAHTSAAAQGDSFGVARFSGLDASSTQDGSAVTNNGTNQFTKSIASWTTANANDLLLIAFMGDGSGTDSAFTPPSGFNDIAQEVNGSSFTHWDFAYEIVSATQSGITPSWGNTGTTENWVSLGVAIKAAAGAAARQQTLMTLGMGA
jgi:hypothetical protein